MSRVILCVPPAYDTQFPLLGAAALTGFLKSRNIGAAQVDANVFFRDYVLGHEDFFRRRQVADARVPGSAYYRNSLRAMARGLPGYAFEYLRETSFLFTEHILSAPYLEKYLADARENFFVGYFDRAVSRQIPADCRLLGFSLTAPSQVLSALTFGYRLKMSRPFLKIVIGGQWVSLFRDELVASAAVLRRCFDFAVYGEGETPCLRLLDALDGRLAFSAVPNLIWQDRGRWRKNSLQGEEALDALSPPDFDGLPLMKYTATQEQRWGRVVPYESARGCYWGKCVFCSDLPNPKPSFREKAVVRVVEDIAHLKKKYRVSTFVFSNATISPAQMRALSRELLRRRVRVRWWVFARLDPGFTLGVLRQARKAGCFRINFGLESGSQRVLDFVRKGIRKAVAERVLCDCRAVGLEWRFQTILGFPTETRAEAMETLDLLLRYPESGSAFNIFYITPKCDVFFNPGEFSVKLAAAPRLPFRFFHPFRMLKGEVDGRYARRMINMYHVLRGKALRLDPGTPGS